MHGQRWILLTAVAVALISNASAADLTVGLHLSDTSLSIAVFTEFTGSIFDCDGSRSAPSPLEYGTAFYCEQILPWRNGSGTDALGRFYQIVSLPPPSPLDWSMVQRNGPLGPEEIVRGGCTEFVDDDGTTRYRKWFLHNVALDAVNGHLYLAVRAQTFLNVYC